MRGNVPQYEMLNVRNLKEALKLLRDEPSKWKPFAGGTDLMVVFETGELQHKKYLNLLNIKELKGIKKNKSHVSLGALTTYSQIRNHEFLKKYYPLLGKAAQLTGSLAIQNRGTLGGNIANASPAADTPPALLVYDAILEINSATEMRELPYSKFHGGYKKIDLKNDELITKIKLPFDEGKFFHFYRKVGTRQAQAISKICFAGVSQIQKGQIKKVRIALGSVAPIPLRCFETEAFLTGQKITESLLVKAEEILSHEITPIDDIRSTANYRRVVTGNLLREFLCGTGSIN